jgi:hypothetical protein
MVGWSCNWWRQVVAVAKKGGVRGMCCAPVILSEDIQKATLLQDWIVAPRRECAALSLQPRRLPLPTKVKERCNRVCQLEASKRSRVRVGHRCELTSATSLGQAGA